jgi:hypothetical protein
LIAKENIIVKRLLIIALAFILCSCASSDGPGTPVSHIITHPNHGGLVIIGVSARLSTRVNELAAATEVAARKAAMYHGLTASFEEVQIIGAGFFDYVHDTHSWVDYDRQLERYIERLSFDPDKDLFRDSNGNVFIRFTYPETFPGNISYQLGTWFDGRPEWIRQPPEEISGFIAGVGRSGRLDRFADTFTRSFEAAALAIAARIYTEIEAEDTIIQSRTTLQFRRQSIANMTHFLILETWIDPQTMAVYTLAIARPAN